MAGSVNKVILIGNLGRDPEVRTFQNGGKVCNLRIATSETWKEKATGERKERTEWHTVTVFNEGLVRIAEQYLRKGSKVYIEGQLQTRKGPSDSDGEAAGMGGTEKQQIWGWAIRNLLKWVTYRPRRHMACALSQQSCLPTD